MTWVNAFPFYVYGDVTYIANAYEFVKSIVNDGTFRLITTFGFIISLGIAGFRSRFGGFGDIAKSAVAPIIIYSLFIVPTVNIHINDLRVDKGLISYSVLDGGYKKVDDVPYAIAAIPAVASTLVSVFIDLIDKSWGSINIGNKFSSLGFKGVSNLSREVMVLSSLENIDNSAQPAVYNLRQYIRHCIAKKAVLISGANKHIMTHPKKPFPEMFNPSIYKGGLGNKRVSFDDNIDASGKRVYEETCSSLYNTYVSGVSTQISDEMKKLVRKRFPQYDPNNAELNKAFRDQIGDKINVIGNIGKAMATLSATRALEHSFNIQGIGVDGVSMASELSIQSTLANIRTEGPAKFLWITKTLPDLITIILGIIIGAFPFMIAVASFFGKDAIQAIGQYFIGYTSINFTLISLVLVNNITSYYTAKHAQEAMVSYAGMPFGLSQINDFMIQQANMAGFAGIIGAIAVFAVTPLILKGETAGFNAAMSGVSNFFRGNVETSAEKTLTDYDAQKTIDEQGPTTFNGYTEAQAAGWLAEEGFSIPQNMSAVQAYNDILQNYDKVGVANASEIFHSGNTENFGPKDYIAGSAAQTMQKIAKTGGFGASVNEGVVDMADIESVSVQDGKALGSSIGKTADLRGASDSYNPNDVGVGQAISQFGKDMGAVALSKLDENANATVANATNAALNQVGAGQGLLQTGAFNSDGTLANNEVTKALQKGASLSAAQKAGEQIGSGAAGEMQEFFDKGLMDGSRGASAINKASKLMKNGVDSKGNALYDQEEAAQGQAMKEVAAHNKNMQTATAANFNKTGEVKGVGDFVSGTGAQDRINANEAIGIGEKWQNMSESEKIATMKKVKDNTVRKTFGSIEAANAELHANGRSVAEAISDDVASARVKGTLASADVRAKKKVGILDENGNVTTNGNEALSIKSGEDANSLVGKREIGQNTQRIIKSVREQAFKAAMVSNNNDIAKANAEANATVAPFLDENGNVLTGQDFWNKQAKLKTGAFSGSNAMLFGEGKIFSGGLGVDGSVTGKLSSGLSSSHNSTTKYEDGYAVKTNLLNPQTRKGQRDLERLRMLKSPAESAMKLAVRAEEEAVSANRILRENGFDTGFTDEQIEKFANNAMGIAEIGVGAGTGLIGLNKITKGGVKRQWDKMRGKGVEGAPDIPKQTPKERSIHSMMTGGGNVNTHSSLPSKEGGLSFGKKVAGAGAVGFAAYTMDALATGNYKEATGFFQNLGHQFMAGNIFTSPNNPNTSVSRVLENIAVGKTAMTKASSLVEKGSYVAGLYTLAKGMSQQAINGVAEVGEMGIAGVRTMYNGQSYSQNRKDNVIPDANFFSQSTGSSKNAYNDTTSNVNTTPQEYQKNNQEDITKNLEDINVGVEYQQDSMSDLAEKLSNTLYKDI